MIIIISWYFNIIITWATAFSFWYLSKYIILRNKFYAVWYYYIIIISWYVVYVYIVFDFSGILSKFKFIFIDNHFVLIK